MLFAFENDFRFEPQHDKTKKMAYAPSEDSDQPEYPPSPIRVFGMRSIGSQGPKLSSCFPDSEDSDQTGRLAHMTVCWFCHEVVHLLFTINQ